MRRIPNILEAYHNGDTFSNEEAIALRDAMKAASDANYNLGIRFKITANECSRVYDRLIDICKARGI